MPLCVTDAALALLFGLVGLVGIVNRLIEAGQNGFDVRGIRAVRRQLQILLVGFHASRRRNQLVSLFILSRLAHQAVCLQVVKQRLVRRNSDCLVGRSHLRICLVRLEEDHRLVLQVKSRLRRIDFGSSVIGIARLLNLARARVNLAQTALG